MLQVLEAKPTALPWLENRRLEQEKQRKEEEKREKVEGTFGKPSKPIVKAYQSGDCLCVYLFIQIFDPI